jgi:hypothetical protein
MAAGSTYTPIATTTIGTAAASYTFSSISGSYTDLVLVASPISSLGSPDMIMQFNGDTGSNYSYIILRGNGSAAASARATSATYIDFCGATAVTTTFGFQANVSIQNYSNATTYKTALVRSNNAGNGTDAIVGLWRNTAAITSITLSLSANLLAAGSTFTLYGIAAA